MKLREQPGDGRESGRVTLIVRRLDDGARETLERVWLSREEGVPGNDRRDRPPRDPEAQLAVMRTSRSEARRQTANLSRPSVAIYFVELDLSAANLPTGTQLAVGQASSR